MRCDELRKEIATPNGRLTRSEMAKHLVDCPSCAQWCDSFAERLGGEKRTTFILFVKAGLSYEEIAQVLGVPIGTVMSRIYYARRKLQAA